MSEQIRLCPPNQQLAADLHLILSNDQALRQSLEIKKAPGSEAELLENIRQFEVRTHGTTYAICKNNRAVGLISISHRQGEHARVGYWLGSRYWYRGLTTLAFKLILDQARQQNIKQLSASMHKDNLASIRIWQHQAAEINEIDGVITTKITL